MKKITSVALGLVAVMAVSSTTLATPAHADTDAPAAVELTTAATTSPSRQLQPMSIGDNELTIVGGVRAPEGAYPWIAQLSIRTAKGSFTCGGSIVSRNIVVTAQHCMEGAKSVQVRYGSNTWGKGTRVNATKVISGAGQERGDWAVVLVDADMTPSSFLPLAASKTYDNGPFRAMGWGDTYENGEGSTALMHVNLPKVDDAYCSAAPNEICAGDYENGGIDTCQGDSGGPLVQMNGGKPVQVGVVSWGDGCARAGQPGHYTRVSTYQGEIAAAVKKLGGARYTTA